MDIKQAFVNGRLMDVVSQDEYARRRSLGSEMVENTCIQMNGTLYPVIPKADSRTTPFAVYSSLAVKYYGNATEHPEFSDNAVVDYSNIKSCQELIDRQNKARKEEVAVLTQQTSKTFYPIIREEDSPALKVVKECFHKKNIDIDNYRGRFDSNCDFNNTTRLLVNPQTHNISVQKIQLIGEKFDIDFHLVAKDKKGAVNPMGATIEKEL